MCSEQVSSGTTAQEPPEAAPLLQSLVDAGGGRIQAEADLVVGGKLLEGGHSPLEVVQNQGVGVVDSLPGVEHMAVLVADMVILWMV